MTKRLTKKQKQELEEQQQVQELEKRINEYPERLIKVLRECTVNGFEIKVDEDLKFEIHCREIFKGYEASYSRYLMMFPFDWEHFYEIERLEDELLILKEERIKKRQQEELKKQALSKLTVEEIKALGL